MLQLHTVVKDEAYFIDILQRLEIDKSKAMRKGDNSRVGTILQDIEITKFKLDSLKR